MHFKVFMCIYMRKLYAERQILADAQDRCQTVFLFNVPKFVPKYYSYHNFWGDQLEL